MDEVVGGGFGGGGRGMGHGGERFLPDGAEFGMDQPLIFFSHFGEVGPEARLRFVAGAGHQAFEVAMLAGDDLAETGFHLGGAVLVSAVQVRHAAEELHFVDAEFPFPLLAPLVPVDAHVHEFAGLFAQTVDVRKRGLGGGEAGFDGIHSPGVFFERQCDVFQRAVVFVERFERGLGRVDGAAVELHLFADMPIEHASEKALPRLNQRVLEAGRARVDGADGGHLGFGRVAGVEQGQQIGDGNGEPAVLALRMAGLDALPDFADRLLEGVLSVHACSS